ncbi:MAG: hypothetical protein KOO63_12620 [Bacteroidales bacterium]|nr:hypothetical protein [Candidatus Latescibacterota bacterium]
MLIGYCGYYYTAVNYGTGDGPHSICSGDLDGDNDLDLVVANVGSDLTVLLNNGNGTYAASNHIDVDNGCPSPIIKLYVKVKSNMSIVVIPDKYGFQHIPTLPYQTLSSARGNPCWWGGQISGSVL